MTAKERRIMERLRICLSAMSRLQPSGPADTAVKTADQLAAALDYLKHQEWDEVTALLDAAERLLEVPARPALHLARREP